MMSSSVESAVNKCFEISRYHVSPFRCYYFNPRKYTPVELMKWTQKYVQNRMYITLLKACEVMGYEVVPSEILLGHGARNGYNNRMVRIGRLSFYLLKREEMSKGLLNRYLDFKEKMAGFRSNRITIK